MSTSLPDEGPFGLMCDELSESFSIASKSTTVVVAIPITKLPPHKANWLNKKRLPAELWKQVTTSRERANVRLLCKSAEMYALIKALANDHSLQMGQGTFEKLTDILAYIETDPEV